MQQSSKEVANTGLESVKSDLSAKKANAVSNPEDTGMRPSMPTKNQLETAVYRPFFPGAATQDDSKVSLDRLDEFSATREMGTGTANTVGMYRTNIDGQEYFVKRVSSFIAQGALTVDKVANRIGLESQILPTTYIENPADSNTAFLLTPMLKEVHDVPTEVLTSALGDSAKDFITHMAIFDHIISNTDRSNFKQLMECGGQIYLADNDNSLEQSNYDFEARTGGHIMELYAEDMNIDHKDLEIPKQLISRAENMMNELDALVEHFTDPEEKDSVKHSLQKGLEGIVALKDIDKPTMRDLYDMSPTMDKLMGF